MGQDEPPPADMAELREAVLEFSETLARPLLGRRRGRMARRLHRRGLRWLNALLLLPWLLVGLVRMVVTGWAAEVVACQWRAVALYRRLSGKDRRVAEAEVRRYCAYPTYQLCYAVGRRELLRLRDAYRERAGGSFRPKTFHDELLAYGGLPVSLARWGMELGE